MARLQDYMFNVDCVLPGKVGPLSGSLNFTAEYTARESLGLEDLSPSSWDSLVDRMVEEEELWQKFFTFYSRGGPMAKEKCDKKCKEGILCRWHHIFT